MAGKPLVVPEAVAPMAMYGELFSVADLVAIREETGLDLQAAADPIATIESLNRAASFLILEFQALESASPAGEISKWAADIESRARSLLAAFGHGSPLEIEAAARQLRGDQFPAILDAGLPLAYSTADLVRDLRPIADLALRASLVAKGHHALKAGKGHVPDAEIQFMNALTKIFQDAFGRPLTVTTHAYVDETYTGPGVRFATAIIRRILDRITKPASIGEVPADSQCDDPMMFAFGQGAASGVGNYSEISLRDDKLVAALRRLLAPGALRDRIKKMRRGKTVPKK